MLLGFVVYLQHYSGRCSVWLAVYWAVFCLLLIMMIMIVVLCVFGNSEKFTIVTVSVHSDSGAMID